MGLKFDVVVGNPPYQENIENRGEQPPIYNFFYDGASAIANVYCLITPARFLFDAGKTPSEWNTKMLNDTSFKVCDYWPNSKDIFGSSVDIKGGVAICLRDRSKEFGAIDTFLPDKTLRNILCKLRNTPYDSFAKLIYSNTSYKYSSLFFTEHPMYANRVSGGSSRYLSSSVFDKFPEEFHESKPVDGELYCQILGRQNNERKIYYFKAKYLDPPENFNHYKVFVPSSNGSGAIGEVFSTPMIGTPMIGTTETFISVGNFINEDEAVSCFKYIKTKFLRCILGMKKVTQGNKRPAIWSLIPIQDFTSSSDIDWSQSIADIDKQLYRKYGLSQHEIDFIEKNIKPME